MTNNNKNRNKKSNNKYTNKKSNNKIKSKSSIKNKKSKNKKLNKIKLSVALLSVIIVIFLGFKTTTATVNFVDNFTNKLFGIKEQKTAVKEVASQYDLATEVKKQEGKYTILIDPGHGGNDGGTEGPKDILEKDVVLKIGKKIASKLSKQKDIQVVISRNDDRYVALPDRVKMANDNNVDLFVSVHLNGETGGNTAHGLETYYRPNAVDDSKKVAKTIQNSIVSYVGLRDREIKEARYEVLTTTTMPAVLIECGFLSNPQEAEKLVTESFQEQFSEGVTQGILSYLDHKKK